MPDLTYMPLLAARRQVGYYWCMAVGFSMWMEMSPEEQRVQLRGEQEEKLQRLRALSAQECIRRFFILRDMGRNFPHEPHSLHPAPALIIG